MSSVSVGAGVAPEAPPSRSIFPFIAIGAVLLIVVVAGGGYAAFGRGEPTPTVVAVPPTSLVLPPPTLALPPPPTSVALPPPPTTAAVAVAPVHITSTPDGAEVLVDGAHYATTPCEFPRPTGSDIVHMTVRASGYQDRTIALTAFGDPEVAVSLDRARSGRPGGHPPATTAEGGHTPPPTTTTAHPPSGGGGDGVLDPWAH
jgi:hypothetical protein